MPSDGGRKDFLESAFSVEDFQGLGRRKIRRLVALFFSEFFGTAVLVFLLCSTVQAKLFGSGQEHLVVGTAAGFAVATSISIFGHISGSHINPALSIAAVVLSEMSLALFAFYTFAQCFGAFFGYGLTRIIIPAAVEVANLTDSDFSTRCCSVPKDGLDTSQLFLVEFIGTALLAWAFCSAIDKRNLDKHDSLPIKFGLVIIALALPLGLYSGCSINPARSFGPALFNQYWHNHWVFWVGPLLGAIFAAVSYRSLFDPTEPPQVRTDPAAINLRNNSHKTDEDA